MHNFSVAGYFFTYLMIFVHKKCVLYTKNHEVIYKRFECLAVFVKITASRSNYLFLQQTVNKLIMSQNKAINENLRTFNFMQTKKKN